LFLLTVSGFVEKYLLLSSWQPEHSLNLSIYIMEYMEDWMKSSMKIFESYVDSFTGLTPLQQHNFSIKKDHSIRVAENALLLSKYLNLSEEEVQIAVLAGIFHDIGRFGQLLKHNTLNDAESFDHADYGVEVLTGKEILKEWSDEVNRLVYKAIQLHNKFVIPTSLTSEELLYTRILRDADKLDIFKVLTEYYSDKSRPPNHTLTWDLPLASQVSAEVAKEVLGGKLVSKQLVKSDVDVKIMQLSWVYDIHFRFSFEEVLKNRFLEKIYNSLPKNDRIIEIYRKIKVFSENKLMA